MKELSIFGVRADNSVRKRILTASSSPISDVGVQKSDTRNQKSDFRIQRSEEIVI